MNSVQRRLFRAFAENGGDLSDDAQVACFIRSVEGTLLLLPPKVRTAVELIWRGTDELSYREVAAELAHRERAKLTLSAVRRRVSRGASALEEVVRNHPWDRMPAPPKSVEHATPATGSVRGRR